MDVIVPTRKRPARPRQTQPLADGESDRLPASQRPTLWKLVADAIENDITTGVFSLGERLPTDVALAKRFKVNRHTARRALSELTRKGLLKSQPQVGHFVQPFRLVHQIRPESRLSSAIERTGFTPGFVVLKRLECIPPVSVASGLAVAGRTKVIELQVVRLANEMPVALVTYWPCLCA